MDDFISPRVRTYIYGLLGPIGLVLTFYNVVDRDALPLWVDLIGALLGGTTNVTAFGYRPTRNPYNNAPRSVDK